MIAIIITLNFWKVIGGHAAKHFLFLRYPDVGWCLGKEANVFG